MAALELKEIKMYSWQSEHTIQFSHWQYTFWFPKQAATTQTEPSNRINNFIFKCNLEHLNKKSFKIYNTHMIKNKTEMENMYGVLIPAEEWWITSEYILHVRLHMKHWISKDGLTCQNHNQTRCRYNYKSDMEAILEKNRSCLNHF